MFRSGSFASRAATAHTMRSNFSAAEESQVRSIACFEPAGPGPKGASHSACWFHHSASSRRALRYSGSLTLCADRRQKRASLSASCLVMVFPSPAPRTGEPPCPPSVPDSLRQRQKGCCRGDTVTRTRCDWSPPARASPIRVHHAFIDVIRTSGLLCAPFK
jgi:hypothetical protein